MIRLNLDRFSFNVFEISQNNGTSVICIDVHTDVKTDYLQFKSGEVTSNTVSGGAVFYVKEAADIQFYGTDA